MILLNFTLMWTFALFFEMYSFIKYGLKDETYFNNN